MKRCSRCGLSKEVRDFYRNAGWKDGLHPYCKSCLLAYQADRWRRFGVRKTSRRWASTLGVVDDYFAEIDTPTKAYLLGLLAADGCVLNHPNWNRISLELGSGDIELLKLFQREVAPGASIRSRTDRSGRSSVIVFSSARIRQDLAAWGVVPRKTFTLSWPSRLPVRFEWGFLLGYFDGDGSLTLERRGEDIYPRWRLLGTQGFLLGARERVAAQLAIKLTSPIRRPGCFLIQASGRNARLLDQWLHQTETLGLERKRLEVLEARLRLSLGKGSAPSAPPGAQGSSG